MSIIPKEDAFVADQAMQLVTRERAAALSQREWKHRLAGYGYSIRATESGKHVLETLPRGIPVCELPDDLFA